VACRDADGDCGGFGVAHANHPTQTDPAQTGTAQLAIAIRNQARSVSRQLRRCVACALYIRTPPT
jgi:hypothetical protein